MSVDNSEAVDMSATALAQLGARRDVITSLSAGMIIHRVGQMNYGFFSEARKFALDLQKYMNDRLSNDATTFVYEEALGQCGRLHWLVHMRNPSVYRRLLRMVDQDKVFQEIYEGDRLPERGGGNWERMFRQSSFIENIFIPQHGIGGNSAEDEAEIDSFVPVARHQLPSMEAAALDSSNAGGIILRSVQAKYEVRDLARFYLYEWQTRLNLCGSGSITSALFEEIWGRQDRLHVMLHVRSVEDYHSVARLEREDEALRRIVSKPRLTIKGEPVGWGGLFESATMTDALLVPLTLDPDMT